MAKFDKLAKAFAEGSNQDKDNADDPSKFRQLDTLQQSLAIVKTIDKLKAQGVQITKKAELDYLLARQVVEKAKISPPPVQETGATTPGESPPESEPISPSLIKRTPQDHPEEFKTAMEFSKSTVEEVEALLKEEKPVPVQKMELYELSKKFLKKYA